MKYISELIGDEYEEWKPYEKVLLACQTGTGKTTFVLDKLLPYAVSKRNPDLPKAPVMIYFVNRVALREQIENALSTKYSQYRDYIRVVSYQRLAGFQMNNVFADIKDTDSEEIKERIIEDQEIYNASYYVFDEAHYFLADCEFNNSIGDCIKNINEIVNWKNGTRESEISGYNVLIRDFYPIFITATPEYFLGMIDFLHLEKFQYQNGNSGIKFKERYIDTDVGFSHVLYYKRSNRNGILSLEDKLPESYRGKGIWMYDGKIYGKENRSQEVKEYYRNAEKVIADIFSSIEQDIRVYRMPSDYSYIVPHFYKNNDDLIREMVNTPETEKWVYFIKNKKAGRDILQRLTSDSKKKANMVESENKKGKTKGAEAFKEITDTEKFDCDVLITTKVLDNGINFSDPKLKHIAIDDMNMTEIKQMIGRRRILSEDGKIHIYFRDIPEGSLRNYIRFNIYEKIRLIKMSMAAINPQLAGKRLNTKNGQSLLKWLSASGQTDNIIVDCFNGQRYAMIPLDVTMLKLQRRKLIIDYFYNMAWLESARNERGEELNRYVQDHLRKSNGEYAKYVQFISEVMSPVEMYLEYVRNNNYNSQIKYFEEIRKRRFTDQGNVFRAQLEKKDKELSDNQHTFIRMELEQLGIVDRDKQTILLSNPMNWIGFRDGLVSDLEQLLRDIGDSEILPKGDNRIKLDKLLKGIVADIKESGVKYRKGNIEDANRVLESVGLSYCLIIADRYTHRAWKVCKKSMK